MTKRPFSRLFTTGFVGTIIAAVCCFTPVLVILLGALGLSWAVGYLDVVLLPMLFLCIFLMIAALWRQRTRP